MQTGRGALFVALVQLQLEQTSSQKWPREKGGLEGVALFVAFTQLRFVLELPCQHGRIVLIQPPARDQGVVPHQDGVYVCLRTTQHGSAHSPH